jgi:hypothetical protein
MEVAEKAAEKAVEKAAEKAADNAAEKAAEEAVMKAAKKVAVQFIDFEGSEISYCEDHALSQDVVIFYALRDSMDSTTI